MSGINRKMVNVENRTVENIHQIAEQLDLPVTIKYNSKDQPAVYIEEPI